MLSESVVVGRFGLSLWERRRMVRGFVLVYWGVPEEPNRGNDRVDRVLDLGPTGVVEPAGWRSGISVKEMSREVVKF